MEQTMEVLRSNVWPASKRVTVSVLVRNEAGIAFWRAVGYSGYDLRLEVMPDARPRPDLGVRRTDAVGR